RGNNRTPTGMSPPATGSHRNGLAKPSAPSVRQGSLLYRCHRLGWPPLYALACILLRYLHQPAKPAAHGGAVPGHSVPQCEPVRLGAFLRHLDLRQQLAIFGIHLVDRAIDRFHAPKIAVVPSEPMRSDPRSGNGVQNLARFRLDLVDVS